MDIIAMPQRSCAQLDSDFNWPRFPRISQDVFQWKPKPKGKKPKSQIDETRTEISYSASTNGDPDFETSTYVSKDLGTPSSRSMESKRSKKRGKKSLKDTSGSVYSDAVSAGGEPPEPTKETCKEMSQLVTLECPLCYDPDCILNKASKCPLLRHNDPEVVDCCTFCDTNCKCAENKNKFLPVSGLVPRDENGIAVTLLKANGGPIENSFEWANRKRWDVPSYVRWEHKISEWITSPTQESAKAEEERHHKKSHRSKNKRKNRNQASAATAVPEITSNSEEHKAEEEDAEGMRLFLDGQGFKIFTKGQEKILINYDRKNCKYIGCSCLPTPIVDTSNCGCGNDGNKTVEKHEKSCPHRVSIGKETSHGVEPLNKKEIEARCGKDKSETEAVKTGSNDKCEPPSSSPDLKDADSKNEAPQAVHLSAKDLRNKSRVDMLEKNLKTLLGSDYKKGDENEADCLNQQPNIDTFASIPCPMLDQSYQYGNIGPCICAQECCYEAV